MTDRGNSTKIRVTEYLGIVYLGRRHIRCRKEDEKIRSIHNLKMKLENKKNQDNNKFNLEGRTVLLRCKDKT